MWTEDEDKYITQNFKKWKVSLQTKYRYTLKEDDIQRVLYIFQKN
jgi:hypothetical protein